MKPRITVITIGVDDLERSLMFYRDGLGLNTDGIVGEEFEYGAVVFIDWKTARSSHFGRERALPTILDSRYKIQAQRNSPWDTT